MKPSARNASHSGLIAALYVLLTLLSAAFGLDKGAIQLRLSEAMTILPCLTSAAVPGLFLGCLLANLLCGALPVDLLVGSLATLLGALGTRALRNHRYLACLPPICANTLLIPPVLCYAYGIRQAIPLLMLGVGAGEAVSCGLLGQVLYTLLRRRGFGTSE